MIIIIPLGGLGERFKKLCYKKPKPLVNVLGKPIIFWLLDNLKLEKIKLVVIPYNSELQKYNFEIMLISRYPGINFKFLNLDCHTAGATDTILRALTNIKDLSDCPVLCMDGDNFYTCDIISMWNGKNTVFYFNDNSNSSAFSFIKFNNEKQISQIVEKNRISSQACCGAYGFNSHRDLIQYCELLLDSGVKQQNEYYLSGVIQLMISNGFNFYGKNISTKNYICLGTPLHVRLFCNNYPVIRADTGIPIQEHYRYCFELDNTLVTLPKVINDYNTVEPIQANIDFLTYLKKMGHTIIIHTTRQMNICNNVGKCMADIGKLTFDTLAKYQIPYDELYFGKPHADYYIDNNVTTTYDDIEKELGFYRSTIDTRSYNNIVPDIIHTFKKTGLDLRGEIYWYTNIPATIKDMFPLFLYSDENYYVMENINGIPFSRLMLSEDLTEEQLSHIINSIERIHSVVVDRVELDIYQNYCTKLTERFNQYDYSKFDRNVEVYHIIYSKLAEYEKQNLGSISVIHGDPVLTNIIINQFGKIKFIDMRGKIGNVLTIYGDKFYDWAKLYQSLIGYDEILEGKIISKEYKNKLINYFTNRFITKFGSVQFEYLKYITASLLFSLIPLHNNAKCIDYFNLIFTLIG